MRLSDIQRKTFTAVATVHENNDGWQYMLLNLEEQTRRPDELIVLYSGVDPIHIWGSMKFNRGLWSPQPNKNDWGHDKRAKGLMRAKGDYVGFFNDDDSYDLRYIEKMMIAAEMSGADAVYCDWSGIPSCDFCLGSSTSGNYIVRTELGRQVGYTDRHYEADGTFIDKIREAADRVVKVPELLYWHNQQP